MSSTETGCNGCNGHENCGRAVLMFAFACVIMGLATGLIFEIRLKTMFNTTPSDVLKEVKELRSELKERDEK